MQRVYELLSQHNRESGRTLRDSTCQGNECEDIDRERADEVEAECQIEASCPEEVIHSLEEVEILHE